MKKKMLIIVFLLLNFFVKGQNLVHFENIGPFPNSIKHYHFAGNISEIVRINDSVFLSGTNAGGLWRSDDTCRSWVCVSNDLPGGVNSIAINPLDSSQIFAVFSFGMNGIFRNIFFSYGIFVSNDTGKTWTIFAFEHKPAGEVDSRSPEIFSQ